MAVDINIPVGLNEDVVLNFEDGTQVLGTPQELIDAASAGNIVGLHVNPAVITPPGDAPAPTDAPADAPADAPTDTPVDAPPADVPAPDDVPTEEPAPTTETPVPEVDPVETDTTALADDVTKLQADEKSSKK